MNCPDLHFIIGGSIIMHTVPLPVFYMGAIDLNPLVRVLTIWKDILP
jgi:hypothetical protein